MKEPREEIMKYETQYPPEPHALFVRKSNVGGVGGMSMPWLFGIVATNISQAENEGAI